MPLRHASEPAQVPGILPCSKSDPGDVGSVPGLAQEGDFPMRRQLYPANQGQTTALKIRGSDCWATPQRFFDDLTAEFDFTLDVCALPPSAKCARYYTPVEDGLSQPWTGRVFCNPPFSNIEPWMRKGDAAVRSGECELAVFLVPSRTGTRWWHEVAQHHEIRWIRGRLRFSGSEINCPFDCCVVVMRAGLFSEVA